MNQPSLNEGLWAAANITKIEVPWSTAVADHPLGMETVLNFSAPQR